MNKMLLAAAAATAMISSAAFASVTYDDAGFGFVGKGDVQLAFGWNNKQAQSNAKDVAFSLQAEESYGVTCEWDTVTGGKTSKIVHHAVTNQRTSSISSTIAYDARLKNQYTGYILNGITGSVVTGTPAPEIGDLCPQGGGSSTSDPAENDARVTAVELESSIGGLYVTYAGNSVLLPLTPVFVAPII